MQRALPGAAGVAPPLSLEPGFLAGGARKAGLVALLGVFMKTVPINSLETLVFKEYWYRL